MYLKIKAFIPVNREIETHIEEFENVQAIHLRGKFIVGIRFHNLHNLLCSFLLDPYNLYYAIHK